MRGILHPADDRVDHGRTMHPGDQAVGPVGFEPTLARS
jgi:hypothetical protein